MTLDFQQVRQQIQQMGQIATLRAQELPQRRARAEALLRQVAGQAEALRRRALQAAQYDPHLRCAIPPEEGAEPLDARFSPPPLPPQATVLAADGSQILADRHSEVSYSLINIGAIRITLGSQDAPQVSIVSRLLFAEDPFAPGPTLSDQQLALERDIYERSYLAELAQSAPQPVVTFTDGPMELWGSAESSATYQESLERYTQVLGRLHALGVAAAGYVDKPSANLVVRLLELAALPEERLAQAREEVVFPGVTDRYLYGRLLRPGERSAVFAILSRSALQYPPEQRIHFFYLNVSASPEPWLARVEIPAWVAQNPQWLGLLHAVLVHQARTLGARAYPYALHRAHEAALVTLSEKEQVTQMILHELRRRGLEVDSESHKQGLKQSGGRTPYRNAPRRRG